MSRSARSIPLICLAALAVAGCGDKAKYKVADGEGTNPALPQPVRTLIPTVNLAKAVGWRPGEKPVAAPGLDVQPFAEGLEHPRWMLALPNGDVLVAETNPTLQPQKPRGILEQIESFSIHDWFKTEAMKRAGAFVPSPNRITLLRSTKGDGRADFRTVLVGGLTTPFGMAFTNGYLYVADTDAVLRFPYKLGQTKITEPGFKVTDLPAWPINHHCFRNVIANADGSKLYVTVGSNSNVGENGIAAEQGRAAVLEVDAKTGAHHVFANGMRNPNGLAWEPTTKALWVTVNERDELGSDLVPDYMTRVFSGQFYGWPWNYFGNHVDVRVKEPKPADLKDKAISVPDYALGPHTASLGIAFADKANLGDRFRDGAFIGQHGSWNRKPRSGYRVIFVPFKDGMPIPGVKSIDVLNGFVDAKGEAEGRPVDVVFDNQGAMLVTDDVGDKIWRVTAAKPSWRTQVRSQVNAVPKHDLGSRAPALGDTASG